MFYLLKAVKSFQFIFVNYSYTMPQLSTTQRFEAIHRMRIKATVSDVARTFNVKRDIIHESRMRFRANSIVSDNPWSGRPRVTTPCENTAIRVTHLRNRFQIAA